MPCWQARDSRGVLREYRACARLGHCADRPRQRKAACCIRVHMSCMPCVARHVISVPELFYVSCPLLLCARSGGLASGCTTLRSTPSKRRKRSVMGIVACVPKASSALRGARAGVSGAPCLCLGTVSFRLRCGEPCLLHCFPAHGPGLRRGSDGRGARCLASVASHLGGCCGLSPGLWVAPVMALGVVAHVVAVACLGGCCPLGCGSGPVLLRLPSLRLRLLGRVQWVGIAWSPFGGAARIPMHSLLCGALAMRCDWQWVLVWRCSWRGISS